MIICYFLELGGTKTTLLITTCFLYGAAFCDITVTAKDGAFLMHTTLFRFLFLSFNLRAWSKLLYHASHLFSNAR